MNPEVGKLENRTVYVCRGESWVGYETGLPESKAIGYFYKIQMRSYASSYSRDIDTSSSSINIFLFSYIVPTLC